MDTTSVAAIIRVTDTSDVSEEYCCNPNQRTVFLVGFETTHGEEQALLQENGSCFEIIMLFGWVEVDEEDLCRAVAEYILG